MSQAKDHKPHATPTTATTIDPLSIFPTTAYLSIDVAREGQMGLKLASWSIKGVSKLPLQLSGAAI